jgi:signal transduction histidine kinase
MKFLEQRTEEILENWIKKTGLQFIDPFYHEIISNVQKSLRLMKIYIRRPNQSLINVLTMKIASERIEAKADLNIFVQNINIGKQIILDMIACSELKEEDKLYGMIQINRFIDTYLNHAITNFTSMQNEIISNKSTFIKEMHKDRLTILGQISASFAHDFRNPLTSIKGFIHLLEKDLQLDDKSKYYFSIINKEMASLEDKVSQFLYQSKVQNLGNDARKFDIISLIAEMIQFMYPKFVTEGIDVKTEFPGPVHVMAVVEQIKQVVLNILNNAVEELSEITQQRRMNIKVAIRDKMAVVALTNNGKKIPSYILENIFEPFISTKSLGTGLGLAVCKEIIEKHGGQISVVSDDDSTTFYFSLPIYSH